MCADCLFYSAIEYTEYCTNVKVTVSRGYFNMYEYKVLTQKDKWFSGKFDPEKLEQAMNAYAEQGWKVITCTTAMFPGMLTGGREEMITILERTKGA
jgi:hypothetical protein